MELPVFWREIDAVIDGIPRPAWQEWFSFEEHCAAKRGFDAKNHFHQLGSPSADEAGEAEDFTAIGAEAGRMARAGDDDVFCLEHHFLRWLCFLFGKPGAECAADHHGDDLLVR